ncbi:MAG: FkbM family methyltransferase [Ferruginibacter sp.]
MLSKIASAIFTAIPETSLKQVIRAFFHRLKYKEYNTYYRNKVWELHYPQFIIRYYDVPSPAMENYLFFKNFKDTPYELIIDGGGFIGTFGFLMASKYPEAKVYIFEANPTNFLRIKKNLSLNNLPNVMVEPLGLWSKPDHIKMNIGSDLGSSLILDSKSNNLIEIEVNSLDEYFSEVKNKKVFIKMNIEGAEIAALNGAREFIQNNKVDCSICTDHYVDGKLTYEPVEKIFKGLGMQSKTLWDSIHINTYSSNINV